MELRGNQSSDSLSLFSAMTCIWAFDFGPLAHRGGHRNTKKRQQVDLIKL